MFDSNKTHDHDMISIRMLILWYFICKSFEMIFQNYLHSCKFPSEWKKANIVPTFKRGNK